MKIQLLILGLGLIKIIYSKGRLIEKNTARTKTTEINTEKPVPPIRLARNVFYNSFTGLSNEDSGESEEFIRSYNNRVRQFFKYKPTPSLKKSTNVVRVARESSENVKEVSKNNKSSTDVSEKMKVVIVKKPIPKFSDIDYEDDFQMKVIRSPIQFIDSGEHEDEDFNLDDYDFDVNHDEYVGRGKPLEPRIRSKETKDSYREPVPKAKEAEKSKESKILLPAIHQQPSIKKERAIERNLRKEAEKMDDDYYDEFTTKTPEKEMKLRDVDDVIGDENEESKEFDHKGLPVRTIRSWNISSYADKSPVMSKFLSILPMFPHLPQQRQLHEIPVSPEAINMAKLDPPNGRPFLF